MNSMNFRVSRAFTLIELLVVIAIIGLLSSIVLASLNTARDKAKVTAIKGNLRNMVPQMELSYSDNSNYSGINTAGNPPYRPSTVCIGPIAGMALSITNGGARARCLSTNVSAWSDLSLRWGASGLIYTTTAPVRAWSASPTGVVTWDAQGVNSSGSFVGTDVTMSWDTAKAACALAGGRLPTVEELKTLGDAQCEALGSTDCTVDSVRNPPGFQASGYWSGTEVPGDGTQAYYVGFGNGFMNNNPKTSTSYVRCVR